MQFETQLSIEEWRHATFGPGGSAMRMATRLNEEMSGLLTALSIDDANLKAAEEVADVAILLYGLASRLGFDLHAEIDRKMAVNRGRLEWEMDGSGHGHHKRT